MLSASLAFDLIDTLLELSDHSPSLRCAESADARLLKGSVGAAGGCFECETLGLVWRNGECFLV